ncbi:MAG TPA: hypothetical protein PKA58_14105 [Polyangium sp.]|nr:hypothetical protein [Polyangium sp.]
MSSEHKANPAAHKSAKTSVRQPKSPAATKKTGAANPGKATKAKSTQDAAAEKDKAAADKAAADKAAADKAAADKAAEEKAAKEKAEKEKAAKAPPAEKTANTGDAKNNCPEKQVDVCDVTYFEMTATPRKLADASDKPDSNAITLKTDKNLRGPLSRKDEAEVAKYGPEYIMLLRNYDLVIEMTASYPSAGVDPETTVDFAVDTKWEGKCAVHPQLILQPQSPIGRQSAKVKPAAVFKDDIAWNQRAADVVTGHGDLPKQEAKKTTELQATQMVWPVGETTVGVTGLTGYPEIGDLISPGKVDAEVPGNAASVAKAKFQRMLGFFRSLVSLGVQITSLGKCVDLEIRAVSHGAAQSPRKANTQLNGLLRIYRDTELGVELSLPLGKKITQKKLAGQAIGAEDTEDPINSDGNQRYELKLKFGKSEIKLDGDSSQTDTAKKLGADVGVTLSSWKQSVLSGTAVADTTAAVQSTVGAVNTEAGKIKDKVDEIKRQGAEAKQKSKDAAVLASTTYQADKAAEDAALGRVPGKYRLLARDIIRTWKMLSAALKAADGIKSFLDMLRRWPKFGWFFDVELAFFALSMSVSIARMARPGKPVLDRFVPLIGNLKFTIEGTLAAIKGTIGFGCDIEFTEKSKVIFAITAEPTAKSTVKIELSSSDNPVLSPAASLELKLKAEFTVVCGSFKMSVSAEIASGIKIDLSVTWVRTDKALQSDIKMRTIPVTLGGTFTEPFFGTMPSFGSIELVGMKDIYTDQGVIKFNEDQK